MGLVRLLLVSPMTVRNLTNDCAVSAMIVFDTLHMEALQMTIKSRRPMGGLPGTRQPAGDQATAKKPMGRPQGEPSTIVNVRLPLTLVAELDRYLDRLEGQTGLKANRGMITRRALTLFLASHAAEDGRGGKG